jgi:glycine dehydrogenase subunit 1
MQLRYLPLTEQDREEMLEVIGVPSVDALYRDVPAGARLQGTIAGLSAHKSEMEVETLIGRMAARNLAAHQAPFFCGAGYYRHHIPAAVDQLLTRGEFLTSYTPYQPEVSQGTLQCLYEFQTQVALLTGMEVANASMYDGATAAAEAVAMAMRITRRRKAILSGNLHPHYRDVIVTEAGLTGSSALCLPAAPAKPETLTPDSETACVVAQTPDLWGCVQDIPALAARCRASGALLIVVVTEILSLGLLPSPGEGGADIVVAEGQSLGNPMSFGGPGVGLFATRMEYVRQMPGRLCGETVDAQEIGRAHV